MKKKSEKVMNLQNNHPANSKTKRIVNLTTQKKEVIILDDFSKSDYFFFSSLLDLINLFTF